MFSSQTSKHCKPVTVLLNKGATPASLICISQIRAWVMGYTQSLKRTQHVRLIYVRALDFVVHGQSGRRGEKHMDVDRALLPQGWTQKAAL